MHKHKRFSAFVLLALLTGVGLAVLVTWRSDVHQGALGKLLAEAGIAVGQLWYKAGCAVTVRLPSRPFSEDASISEAYDQAARLWQKVLCTSGPDQKQALLTKIVELYTEALREQPGFASAYINRGATYMELGEYHRAIADFSAALRISPTSADALKNRGLAYERQGRLREALADFEAFLRMIAQDPTERRAEERVRFAAKVRMLRAKLDELQRLHAELADTEWVLISLNGRSPIEGSQITLKFTDGQLGGFAGCNRYGGDYEVTEDGRLRIPKTLFEITVMACAEPTGVMEQERAYVEALRAAATYRLVGDRLEIQNAAGDTALVFRRKPGYPADPARLVGTPWRLVSLNGEEPVAGSTVTLAFLNDHLAGGHAGCRGYVFAYRASGDDIRFPFQAMIGEPCLDREALMRQEGRYTTAFDWVTDYRLDEGRLELFTARGEVLVFDPLPPEADAGLEGTSWRLQAFVVEEQMEGMEVPVPRVTNALEGTEITALFGDGAVTGSAGCNRYSGRYQRNDGRLTVEELAWTEMACTTPAGVMEQEQRYLEFLAGVTSYRIVGRQLWLDAGEGCVLVFVYRSERRY